MTDDRLRYRDASEEPRELERFLEGFLGLRGEAAQEAVRAVSTESEPSKQVKNRLGQAANQCDRGLVHFRVRDKASHDELVELLVARWARTPWAKVGAVAVAYPKARILTIATIVTWRPLEFVSRLSTLFPEVVVKAALGSPSDRSAKVGSDLPSSIEGRGAWLEIYAGGDREPGWRIGEVLWSPTRDARGADRYSRMREVAEGDLVLHSVSGTIASWSVAAGRAAETKDPFPDEERPGPFYRVPLRDHLGLSRPVALMELARRFAEEIGTEIAEDRPAYYPFCVRSGIVRTNEGMYLARLTPKLYALILRSQVRAAYPIDDALDGLFLERGTLERILDLLRSRKNVILQGPPGVGKTFVAKRVAFALMGERDETRLASVQLHQSYGYEDFVQGIRPRRAGGFERRDGIFLRFCAKAQMDPNRPHVLIVDEINRSNLSKVFGELLVLIEADKRGEALSLMYQNEDEMPFSVPPNLHLLGMMNTADRSLAVVDYALRRRFAFVTLEPRFESAEFAANLGDAGVPTAVVVKIVERVRRLNETISADVRHLGPGFAVGHSFFANYDRSEPAENWYARVVENEIAPLLREYWFDQPQHAQEWITELLR